MIHHSRGLSGHCKNDAFVEALVANPATVSTTPKLRALIDYTIKLSRTPGRMVEEDVASLREVGYSDEAILGINQINGFFQWCNRTIDGLGVELEPWMNP